MVKIIMREFFGPLTELLMEKSPKIEPIEIAGTVNAKIEPTYPSLIYWINNITKYNNEYWSEGYNHLRTAHEKETAENWEAELVPLTEGRPQQILEKDRVSREIIRAILSVDEWVSIVGKDYSSYGVFYPIVFPDIPDEQIQARLYALKGAGLLDKTLAPRYEAWCFQSEIIYNQTFGVFKTDNPTVIRTKLDRKYRKNSPLRDSLTKMLQPFQAEKPIFHRPPRTLETIVQMIAPLVK